MIYGKAESRRRAANYKPGIIIDALARCVKLKTEKLKSALKGRTPSRSRANALFVSFFLFIAFAGARAIEVNSLG